MIHPSVVLLVVPDKAALLAAVSSCAEKGIKNRVFHESDMGDEPTSLATEPINGECRKLFRKFSLFSGV